MALTGRSASSAKIRCLKTAAAFALVLTDALKGFCSWCFLLGLQGSSLLVWIKSNQHSGPHGVDMCVWSTDKPRGCAGGGGGLALTKEGLGSQPRPPPHVLHGVFQERFIPPPSPPPFIKRSQIYAMAIMICACILLPCSFGGRKV